MVKLKKVYFDDFLRGIRLTESQRKAAKKGHETLRERLLDNHSGGEIVTTFLQGSYRRATAIKPQDGKSSDVDVVVVTNFDPSEWTPKAALEFFEPFLEKYYKGKYTQQSRSYQIQLAEVELDLVVTSAASQAFVDEFRNDQIAIRAILKSSDPITEMTIQVPTPTFKSFIFRDFDESEVLRIPDRDLGRWEETHPIEQILWTYEKNDKCNGHYVNVVKAVKWWQRLNSDAVEHPKGYPLEHIVGDHCPDGIESIEEGLIATFRAIKQKYSWHAIMGEVPVSYDRGIRTNVLTRITKKQFAQFYKEIERVCETLDQITDTDDECEKIRLWGEIFGEAFPNPPAKCDEAQSANETRKPAVPGGRFA